MRPWDGQNSVPTDTASADPRGFIQWRESEVLDTLGIEMDFAAVIPRKALDKFRNDAFSSVPPVEERRNDGKSHVTPSSRRPQFQLSLESLGGARAAADGRGHPAATSKHS